MAAGAARPSFLPSSLSLSLQATNVDGERMNTNPVGGKDILE